MKSLSLIHCSWLKPFADYCIGQQIAIQVYCQQANVEPDRVMAGEGWITKQQLYGFLNDLADGEGLPEIGFVVGESMTPESLGAIGEAVLQSKTLGSAIRVFCKLINRSTEENLATMQECQDPRYVWLYNQTLNPFPADRRIADHAGLMTMINIVRLAAGSNWCPHRVTLQTAFTDAHRRTQGFQNTTFQFEHHATGLTFPSEWLLASINPANSDRLKSEPEIAQDLLQEKETILEKLKRLLHNLLGIGGISPTAALLAELCQTSPRSFHRKLGELGYSFQQLLDEVRLRRAKELLSDRQIPVKSIAYDLGYSGANNFIRSFKRMTGLTPSEFREQ